MPSTRFWTDAKVRFATPTPRKPALLPSKTARSIGLRSLSLSITETPASRLRKARPTPMASRPRLFRPGIGTPKSQWYT